jgi:hypothetical protein
MTIFELIGKFPILIPLIVMGGIFLALGLYKLVKDWLPW